MVGDRMMVAPLCAGEPSRKVVMPQGEWCDFWTGERVQGGTEFSLSASTARIPVYVKSGSIIPWADVGLHAGAPEGRRLTARVCGDGALPFTIGTGKEALRLQWSAGTGKVEGARDRYAIGTWNVMG